jgi:tetratricopeptide (TPR) repeat protein
MRDPDPHERPLRLLVSTGRFREALALFLGGEDPAELPGPGSQLLAAQAAARVGELAMARRLAGRARELFRAEGEYARVLEATNLLGAVAFEEGNIPEAEACFGEVLVTARERGLRLLEARSANNLASVAHLRGREEAARDLYQQALHAWLALRDRRGTAEAWHNLALCHRRMGAVPEAGVACDEAVEAADRHGETGLLALTLLGRAELRIDEGFFTEATRDIDRAELLAWSAGNAPNRLEAERLRALAALRQGKSKSAYLLAEAASLRATEAGFTQLAAETASIAALALRADGREREAEVAREGVIAAYRGLDAADLLRRFEREWEGIGVAV